jgi:competence protein ComEA
MGLGFLAALLCGAAELPPLPPVPAGTVPSPMVASVEGPVPAATGPPAKVSRKPGKPVMIGVLNLNRATEAELRLLPGIGKRRAQLIVERRAKRPFRNVEEVGRIKGLRALVQRLRPRLTVDGDTTLRPLRIDRNVGGE